MLREILFRGKCKNDNKWLYGFPYVTRKYAVKINWYCSEFGSMRTDEIIPETVGQFIGLTDKNGKKIFEGDICRFRRFNDIYIGKIAFNVKTASFIMWYQPIVESYGKKATQKKLLSVRDNIEVIGNIHDNPELLENSSL